MSLVKLASLTSPVIPGTYVWGSSNKMIGFKHNGNNARPLVVISVKDGIAYCCPTSASADAWNEQNTQHIIPKVLNPKLMGYKDSWFAVNQVFDTGWIEIPVKELQYSTRMVLPEGFVTMCGELLHKWEQDSTVVKKRWNAPLSKSRKKSIVKRVSVTTSLVMSQFIPTA